MASTKKKIRDLERLLRKTGTSDVSFAEVINAKMAKLRTNLETNKQNMKEQKMSMKYRMVKFVERKKVVRKIKAVDTSLLSCTDSLEEDRLNVERSTHMSDLAYIMYYPRDMKYVSLFGGESKSAALESAEAKSDMKDKSDKIQRVARTRALEARAEDIRYNNTDRVQHAIDVESSPGNGKKERKNSKSVVGDGIEDMESPLKKKKTITYSEEVLSAMKVKDVDADLEEEEEVEEEEEGDAAQILLAHGSDSDSDDDSNGSDIGDAYKYLEQDDDEENMKEVVESKSPTSSRDDSKGESKEDGRDSKDNGMPGLHQDIKNCEPDPFFLEESKGIDMAEFDQQFKEDDTDAISSKSKLARLRATKGAFVQGIGSAKNRDPSQPLHKQEIRLLKWKAERHNKELHGRGGFGRGGGGRGSPGGRSPGKRSYEDAKDSGSPRDGRGGRGGRGRGERGDHFDSRAGGRMHKAPASDAMPISNVGGVSAKAMTEGTIQKAKGSIVKSTGKKTTFD